MALCFYTCSYCDQLKLSDSTHVLQPFLPSILEGLVQLAAQFSSEVLTLVMETLCIVCTVDPAFTTSAENKICPLTIAIFLKYNNGICIRPILPLPVSVGSWLLLHTDKKSTHPPYPLLCLLRPCGGFSGPGHLQGTGPD